jgi:amidohydrolase
MNVPERKHLKAGACAAIDRRADEIVALAEELWRCPEIGFEEVQTAGIVCRELERLGVPYRAGLALTGVKGLASGGAAGPTVAVLGEMDALILPQHPAADPETGRVHACGHHLQVTTMLAVGMALVPTGIVRRLAGNLALFAVPAEEYGQLEVPRRLRRQGKLGYLVGKPELIRLGELDDVDLALQTKISTHVGDRTINAFRSSNACLAKWLRFEGRAARADHFPHQGVNALNAATLALAAINAQRETFRDDDSVRVHPILRRGGDEVTLVPDEATVETFVRARTIEGLEDANRKVDRSARAGAVAVGGTVAIETALLALPLRNDPGLIELFRANAEALVGAEGVRLGGHLPGSTDLGDLSHIMPCLHSSAGGVAGSIHGADFRVVDYELATLIPAKALAMTVVDLLVDDAREARRVLERSRPAMTRAEYLTLHGRLTGDRIYDERAES